jgi:hypothetical protein
VTALAAAQEEVQQIADDLEVRRARESRSLERLLAGGGAFSGFPSGILPCLGFEGIAPEAVQHRIQGVM